MGKVLSGDYSGCSIRANKKSLKIEYVSVSNPIDKRSIIDHEVTSKIDSYLQVKVKYINNGYEKESILQLTDKEFEILMTAIEEQTEKPVAVKVKSKPVQSSTNSASNLNGTLKCKHCQQIKPRNQFTIVNVKPSPYCNSCNEEFARQREERAAKNGETALWRLIGFESKAQYIANRKDGYVKWNNGYEIVTSGKWITMNNGEPSTYRWKGRVFRTNGEWIATSRNGIVKVIAKTRDEAVDKLMEAIYRGGLSQTVNQIRSTDAPSNPKKSGFWATIKSTLGLKGGN
ncbi:hypothetical protein [Neobacillus drentensis]|uniref:hypothetical protein n=1 Tax=Neobacillus drentensis TaxID=220684 RepID=UPI0008246BE4|nr:hypothetical protein [Neobacillus drentensis]